MVNYRFLPPHLVACGDCLVASVCFPVPVAWIAIGIHCYAGIGAVDKIHIRPQSHVNGSHSSCVIPPLMCCPNPCVYPSQELANNVRECPNVFKNCRPIVHVKHTRANRHPIIQFSYKTFSSPVLPNRQRIRWAVNRSHILPDLFVICKRSSLSIRS